MAIKALLFSIFLLFSLASFADSDDVDCVYTAYIRTGSIVNGGTDSVISLQLSDSYGNSVEFPNLIAWGGLMGPGNNYFERGNLDIFSGRAKCLSGAVCAMNLTSDGSGASQGWYVNYVEVTQTGVHSVCSQEMFTVEQWLALNTAPFALTAIRNYCYVPTERHAKVIKSVASEM